MSDQIIISILTGGKSSRMNFQNKSFLKIHNKTFIELLLDQLKILGYEIVINVNDDEEKYSKFGFNPAELIPESNINPTKLWEVLLNEVSLISKNHFKILVLKILKDQKNKFIVFPASISYQYNYQNGLLAQTISMVNSAKLLRKNYEFDYDLLLSGISLHQIGKLYSINVGFSNSSKSSNEKALLGNAILSKDLVGEYINQIPTFPKEDKIKLDHLILSYQGRREWMSPIEPQTIEAILLHTISYLDSQINILKR